MTIRSAVDDPNGRTVELTDERWEHIVERHPDLQTLDEIVLQAVRAPDHRMAGPLANEEWYYAKTDTPYAEGRGHIVTAYARRSMP